MNNQNLGLYKRIIKLIFILAISHTLINCTSVQPWQRRNLAKPQMALDSASMINELRSHNYGSREAGSGGNSASGGGCGCY
jgi:uncharacterized SAM-binding protein YcdF (DUF218 family)